MLGSTAVAKQLLREIADKLVADNIAPEALFVRLGMAVRKKECALWNENQYDISGNFFSKHNFFQSESNVPQCVLSKERQRTIWWPALACPVIFTWHDLLSSIRKIACTTRLLCLVCPSYHIVVPISPILHSKRPSFESRLTSRIFIVYVTVGRGECAKLLFVFFYVLHFHKLQACFNMVPVCFFLHLDISRWRVVSNTLGILAWPFVDCAVRSISPLRLGPQWLEPGQQVILKRPKRALGLCCSVLPVLCITCQIHLLSSRSFVISVGNPTLMKDQHRRVCDCFAKRGWEICTG